MNWTSIRRKVKHAADTFVRSMLWISVATICYVAFLICTAGYFGKLSFESYNWECAFRVYLTCPFWIMTVCLVYLLPKWKKLLAFGPFVLAICSLLPTGIVLRYPPPFCQQRVSIPNWSVSKRDFYDRSSHTVVLMLDKTIVPGIMWSREVKSYNLSSGMYDPSVHIVSADSETVDVEIKDDDGTRMMNVRLSDGKERPIVLFH